MRWKEGDDDYLKDGIRHDEAREDARRESRGHSGRRGRQIAGGDRPPLGTIRDRRAVWQVRREHITDPVGDLHVGDAADSILEDAFEVGDVACEAPVWVPLRSAV
jgi:hypothetical protein